MKKCEVVTAIIFLPKKFSEGTASVHTLLKESGYFDLHGQINETDIFDRLISNLECIDQWLNYSQDNRSSPGWYFSQNKNDRYEVGFYPPERNLEPKEYADKTKACAVFIKSEVETIRVAYSLVNK